MAAHKDVPTEGRICSLEALEQRLMLDADFGDAPDGPYPTLLASNGAYHLPADMAWLGPLSPGPDCERDGQPDPNALGDDNDAIGDDENGVVFPVLTEGVTSNLQVTVSNAVNPGGHLDAWIDWNANGSWLDPGEQIASTLLLPNGTHNLAVTPPAGSAGKTFARFRISQAGGLQPTGGWGDGEVEDYAVYVNPGAQYKWDQTPEPAEPDNLYYGWNEPSIYEELEPPN